MSAIRQQILQLFLQQGCISDENLKKFYTLKFGPPNQKIEDIVAPFNELLRFMQFELKSLFYEFDGQKYWILLNNGMPHPVDQKEEKEEKEGKKKQPPLEDINTFSSNLEPFTIKIFQALLDFMLNNGGKILEAAYGKYVTRQQKNIPNKAWR